MKQGTTRLRVEDSGIFSGINSERRIRQGERASRPFGHQHSHRIPTPHTGATPIPPGRSSALFWFCWLRGMLVGLLVLVMPSCAHQSLPPDSFLMVQLISERLALAQDVAQAKRAAGLPIRDRSREEAVVLRVVEQAYEAGLHPGIAERLIRAQIEASCLEQERWMKQWNNGGNPPQTATPDLEVLRQKLNRLSSQILAEWAALEESSLPAEALKARLIQDGYSPSAATAAAAFAH